MFLCDRCLKKHYMNDQSLLQSYGLCEKCGNMSDCNDIKCSHLTLRNDPADDGEKNLDEVESVVVGGMPPDEIKSIRTLKARVEKLEKIEKSYEMLRKDHAAMKDRIDKAWHAVCGSGMPAPDALARLLEIIDGQHGDTDPHMAAIDVLRAKVDE